MFYILALWLCQLTPSHAETNRILVSIKPLHSLVTGLTQGITEPRLLLNGTQSPHDYQLRPSERRLIQQADIIIIASPHIESFIASMQTAFKNKRFIALSDIPGIKTLPARRVDNDEHNHHHDIDGHLWLSIDNAVIFLQHLSTVFIEDDPANHDRYLQNRDHLIKKLKVLKQQISDQLKPVSDQPFITFHDAFQYFETEFNLHNSLFVTINPEHKPGIKQIRYLKQQIQQQQIRCIFYEPPQIPKIIDTLNEGQLMQVLPLEPLGNFLNSGAELYFQLLSNTAQQLHNCLSKSGN
jgi:zinc transport system substrate-binding protein